MTPRELAQSRLTAYAVIRAAIAQDTDTGVLLINNTATVPDHLDGQLVQLCISRASASSRALLSANGYNVAETLRVIDTWMDEAARSLAAAEGQVA
ncbi:MAG: hypothetical protein ACLP2J_14995 [Acidimicrobiales bacterium]